VEDATRKEYCFVIYTGERDYYLAAYSAEDKEKWMGILKEVCEENAATIPKHPVSPSRQHTKTLLPRGLDFKINKRKETTNVNIVEQ
jgi:hypothetical protein